MFEYRRARAYGYKRERKCERKRLTDIGINTDRQRQTDRQTGRQADRPKPAGRQTQTQKEEIFLTEVW